MQRTLTALALATTFGVDARVRRHVSDDHPFMNTDEHVVFHEDGGSSHYAQELIDHVDKYSELLSNKDFKKPAKKSMYERTWELLLGPSNEQTPLQQQLHQETQYKNHRLGAKWTFEQYGNNPRKLFEAKFWLSGANGYAENLGIVDSATDLTMVKGACKECDFTTTNAWNIWPALEVSPPKYQIDPKNVTVTYGQGDMKGQWVRGELLLDQSQELYDKQFDFLYVEHDKGIFNKTNGVFGLARPGKQMKLNQGMTPDHGHKLFLDSWSAMDNKKYFSTHFTTDAFSWIDMGSLRGELKKEEMPQIEMYNDFFWSTGNRAIRVGDNNANVLWYGESKQAVLDEKNELYTILDTGASEIYISALYFESFINKFFQIQGFKKDDFEATNKTVTATCDGSEDMKSVYFLMGDQWLEIKPEMFYNFDKAAKLCKFHFKGIDAPFNIIGLPLYMDYYVSHFMGEGDEPTTMSFTSTTSEVKNAPEAVGDNLVLDEKNKMMVQFASQDDEAPVQNASIIAGVVFVVVFGFIIWYGIYEFLNDRMEAWVMGLVITGGFFASLVLAAIVWIVMYDELTPGENMEQVEEPGKAITKVNATNMTVFGIISYGVYKFFGQKKAEEKTPVAAEVETEIESANVLM